MHVFLVVKIFNKANIFKVTFTIRKLHKPGFVFLFGRSLVFCLLRCSSLSPGLSLSPFFSLKFLKCDEFRVTWRLSFDAVIIDPFFLTIWYF